MSESVQQVELHSICKFIDYRGKTPEKTTSGIPLITAKIVKNGRIDSYGEYIAESDYETWMRRGIPQAGDVIITTEAPLGEVAEVPRGKVAFAQRIIVLSPDRSKATPKYIKYVLQSPNVQNSLQARASGTVVTGIRSSELQKIMIPLPSLTEQEIIAKILGSLDDKIELNNQINETLESMAKTIFKEWFIDFGPVRAKAEGKKPFGMDDDTAALFPDSFEESELGLIPKGWKVCRLAEISELLSGGTPKTTNSDYWNGNIPWFSVVDTPKGSEVWLIDTEKKITQLGVDHSSTKILPIGTTIVSARGTVGNLALVAVPTAMNQSCYGVRGKGYDDYFIYLTIGNMVTQLKQNAHGSVFDTITKETFNGVSAVVPSKENFVLKRFEAMVRPIFEKIKSNVFETKILAQIRGLLLPKLISGEITLGKLNE